MANLLRLRKMRPPKHEGGHPRTKLYNARPLTPKHV
jgi:hypothetical protein